MLAFFAFLVVLIAGPLAWAAVLAHYRQRETVASQVPGSVLSLSISGADRESGAWLAFLSDCRAVLARQEMGLPTSVAPAYISSMKLRTRTARILARVMVVRLTERTMRSKPTVH